MSKIDDSTRLHHMLDASREAVLFVQRKSRDDLESDRILSLALVRLLEIICEAASKVSPEKKANLPQIYWKQITGMRNRIAHAYFGIDLSRKATQNIENILNYIHNNKIYNLYFIFHDMQTNKFRAS